MRALIVSMVLAIHGIAAAGAPRDAWVLFSGSSVQMSGSTRDLADARAAVGPRRALWVRRGGHAWVIHDATLLARADALFAPVKELERRQEPLEREQGRLGAEQQALARRMERLTAREARQEEREALARQQEALGRQQEALGRQQEALGRQVEQAATVAEGRLGALVEQAIADGLAQRLR